MAVVLDPVTVYSSGIVVSAGDTSYAEVLEAGGNDLISATSGGVVAETSMGAGTLLVAESGAIVSGININDEGAVFSGTEVYCSGAEKWYGPAACATFGSIVLVGGTFTGNVASASGGLLGQGGALEGYEGFISVSGGVYDANSATGGGGAILGIGGRTEITDAEFTANSATYGGAVEISQDGGTARISGGAFTGNSAGYGGAFEVHQGASAYISGAEFMGNQAGSGGAVMVDAYAAQKSYLTLVNATFTKNVAEYGGAVLNDGVLVVSGGEFVANTAEDGRGGALYNNLGTATVSGANFAANTATYGGAIWQGTKKLSLNDVVIDGNSAIYGGALYANGSGATEIKNASFSGNSAYYDEDYDLGGMGGALYVTAAATVTVTDTIFGDNVAVVNPDNEWDGGCGGAVINYGNLTVTGGEFSGNSAYYGAGLYNQAGAGTPMTVTNANFLNNSATYGGGGICNCWGELVVSGGTYSGNTVEFRDGAGIANWSDATITDAIFMENVAVKGGAIGHTGTTLTVDGAVFGENGATEEGGAIWIMNEWGDSVATLVNCSYTENTAEAGGAIWNGEELTVSGGEFSGNAASDGKGGAIYNSGAAVVSGANFVDNTAIYGGAIWHGGETLELADAYVADNTAIYGAALYANGSGATVISAASFEGNRANYDEDYDLGGMGGALYVTAPATVTVTDAIFENNVAEVNPDNEWDGGCGGAVINYGNLTVSGGAFNANSAYYGAGLYNQAGAGKPMTVESADFANNSATYGGGAICNCWGELVVSGGEYTGNTVTVRDGGAIANWSVATITAAVFTENEAVKGGAISNTGTTLTVSDTYFGSNMAEDGGAFWQLKDAYASPVAVFTACSFEGNAAGEKGGAIDDEGTQLTVTNCIFDGNVAGEKGGAIYTVTEAAAEEASFYSNSAIYGGAIYANGGALTLADTDLAANLAIYGGAIYANGSGTTVISGGEFLSNSAYYDEDYDLGGMGGALYVTAAATVTATDTIFDGNVAEVNPDNEWDGGCGGAVINYGNLTVSGGAFNANSAYYGAGLYNQAGAGTPMTVADADFTNNSATYGGGAICNCWGELVVSGGTFTSNTVERSDGGAIANWSVATVTDATFTANTAATGGAISNSWSESITIDGALFTGNTATQGGAFWQNSGTATISNTTFSGNTAEAGGAIWNSAEITLDNCTFATASDTIWNSGTITVTGATTFSAEVTNTDDGVFAVALGDAGDPALVNGWSNLAGGTISIIAPDAMTLDAAYRVATGVGDWSGAVALAVGAIEVPGAFEIRDGVVSSGTVLCNGVAYVLGAGDDALALSAEEVEVQSEAKPFSGGGATTLVNGDLAAEWGVGTQCPDGVTLADDTLTGNVLLEIDGTEVGGALFGAAGNYVGTVNIEAKSGTIRNLAAGAEANGSVAGVKLLLAEADVAGVAYAGGFGNVAGETETQIDGGTFAKDFYAGALANYKKTGTVTNTGDIRFTIDGGEFSGNVYGASAVKAGSATTTVHTAGDVTLKLAGGSTAKDDFCCFAGGYATGSAESTTAVYTVGDIDVEISGGSWGKAHGGRGLFGGVFASKVTAEAQDVSITISGGTLGNVYGGGWAQKGGKSIVGDVSITITDGTLANVFGGGSTSTSGGSTSAKNVTITVSGGNITGAIYAKGQTEYDLVASAVVTFTGAADYGCGVYGYDHVDGAASNAALTFNAYTGSFSGDIGGFASVKFAGGTAMTLGTAAADVSNTAWTFDIAERSETLAGTALLDWAAADFAGDTIALDPGTTTPTEWTLIAAASTTAYGTFDVEGIATGLVLDQQIADTGTAWDGWGFTLDESTLKFKHLA